MNILLLGSGGREHAMAWKMEQSPLCNKLYIAPGNAGTELCGINVPLDINDFQSVADFVVQHKIHMVVVGPEEPLVKGIADFFKGYEPTKDVLFVGPDSKGALLEGSKEFAKDFMKKYHIPTAGYQSFTKQTFHQGIEFLKILKPPYVLKADGLAAGKGVLICPTFNEATEGLKTLLLDEAFGKASQKVVIEEFLDGIEISVFVASDGKNWILLPSAKDYKRIGEGDSGPNTGGMGAVSPVPFADTAFMEKVKNRIIQPTIDGLIKEQIPYKGFIFLGLMNVQGEPFVIEYNVRLGDPETEAILPLINSDFVEMLQAIASGNLDSYLPVICPEFAHTIVLVSGGYPGAYEKNKEITGIEHLQGSQLFFAGAREEAGRIFTSGGRVIVLTSVHPVLEKARDLNIENASKIQFQDAYFRTDIGLDLQK